MIRDGHDFLALLHRIREEESERAKGMNSEEYVRLIQKEAEAVLQEAGYRLQLAPDGFGSVIVKGEEV